MFVSISAYSSQEVPTFALKYDDDSPYIEAPDDLSFTDWVHNEFGGAGWNVYTADLSAAIVGGASPDEYYIVNVGARVIDDDAGIDDVGYLRVDLFHRVAFGLTDLGLESWSLIGRNNTLYDGGHDALFNEWVWKNIHYTSVYRYQCAQWKLEARNFNGWASGSPTPTPFSTYISNRLFFNSTATPTNTPTYTPPPTPTSTRTPTNTPTHTRTPTHTPTFTFTSTPAPTNTPTPLPTATPTPISTTGVINIAISEIRGATRIFFDSFQLYSVVVRNNGTLDATGTIPLSVTAPDFLKSFTLPAIATDDDANPSFYYSASGLPVGTTVTLYAVHEYPDHNVADNVNSLVIEVYGNTPTPTHTHTPTPTHTYTPTNTPTSTNTPTMTPTIVPTLIVLEDQMRNLSDGGARAGALLASYVIGVTEPFDVVPNTAGITRNDIVYRFYPGSIIRTATEFYWLRDTGGTKEWIPFTTKSTSTVVITDDDTTEKILTDVGNGSADEIVLEDSYMPSTTKLYVYGIRWQPRNLETIASDSWMFYESENGVTPRHPVPINAALLVEYLKWRNVFYLIAEDDRYLITEDNKKLLLYESDY